MSYSSGSFNYEIEYNRASLFKYLNLYFRFLCLSHLKIWLQLLAQHIIYTHSLSF